MGTIRTELTEGAVIQEGPAQAATEQVRCP